MAKLHTFFIIIITHSILYANQLVLNETFENPISSRDLRTGKSTVNFHGWSTGKILASYQFQEGKILINNTTNNRGIHSNSSQVFTKNGDSYTVSTEFNNLSLVIPKNFINHPHSVFIGFASSNSELKYFNSLVDIKNSNTSSGLTQDCVYLAWDNNIPNLSQGTLKLYYKNNHTSNNLMLRPSNFWKNNQDYRLELTLTLVDIKTALFEVSYKVIHLNSDTPKKATIHSESTELTLPHILKYGMKASIYAKRALETNHFDSLDNLQISYEVKAIADKEKLKKEAEKIQAQKIAAQKKAQVLKLAETEKAKQDLAKANLQKETASKANTPTNSTNNSVSFPLITKSSRLKIITFNRSYSQKQSKDKYLYLTLRSWSEDGENDAPYTYIDEGTKNGYLQFNNNPKAAGIHFITKYHFLHENETYTLQALFKNFTKIINQSSNKESTSNHWGIGAYSANQPLSAEESLVSITDPKLQFNHVSLIGFGQPEISCDLHNSFSKSVDSEEISNFFEEGQDYLVQLKLTLKNLKTAEFQIKYTIYNALNHNKRFDSKTYTRKMPKLLEQGFRVSAFGKNSLTHSHFKGIIYKRISAQNLQILDCAAKENANRVFLTKDMITIKRAQWRITENTSVDENYLQSAKARYSHGIGVKTSHLDIDLSDKNYTSFYVTPALNPGSSDINTKAKLSIELDGKTVYSSIKEGFNNLGNFENPEELMVDVSNAKLLTLKVSSAPGAKYSPFIDWINAYFLK